MIINIANVSNSTLSLFTFPEVILQTICGIQHCYPKGTSIDKTFFHWKTVHEDIRVVFYTALFLCGCGHDVLTSLLRLRLG